MISRRIVLKFPHRLIDRPITCTLVKQYHLEFNILKASITPREEGILVLELKGRIENLKKGMVYLKELGIQVESLKKDILRSDARCTHCGACLSICPTKAFTVDPNTRKIFFDDSECIACELCIPSCPPRAMEAHF